MRRTLLTAALVLAAFAGGLVTGANLPDSNQEDALLLQSTLTCQKLGYPRDHAAHQACRERVIQRYYEHLIAKPGM